MQGHHGRKKRKREHTEDHSMSPSRKRRRTDSSDSEKHAVGDVEANGSSYPKMCYPRISVRQYRKRRRR